MRGMAAWKGMTSFLYEKKIRIFDYPQFAQSLQDELIAHTQKIADENNLAIEYIRKKNFRREERIAEILKERNSNVSLWLVLFPSLSITFRLATGTTISIRIRDEKQFSG